jgi:hypothetical protein
VYVLLVHNCGECRICKLFTGRLKPTLFTINKTETRFSQPCPAALPGDLGRENCKCFRGNISFLPAVAGSNLHFFTGRTARTRTTRTRTTRTTKQMVDPRCTT